MTVTLADKNFELVILHKQDYINKTLKFFANNNISPQPNDKIFKTHITNLRKILKVASITLTKINNNKPIDKLIPSNPVIPQLYSPVKLHKTDKSIRPIVTNVNIPTSKLATLLQTLLNKRLKFKVSYAIKNTQIPKKHLPNTYITDIHLLLSFDITNLYTNISIDDAIKLVIN